MNGAVPEAAISVIVPARNAAATLPRTLAALAEQDLNEPYEVIVVDNGSADATASIAAAAPGPITVVAGSGGRAGEARNRGAHLAAAPALAFTDADCVPTPTWLSRGLAALSSAELVQGAVQPDAAAPLGPFDRTVSVGAEIGLYETANLFVRKEVFDRVGGFEDVVATDVESPFGEDVWFGWQARRAGARTVFAPDAVVQHAVFPRGPAGYVAESARRGLFCALAARIPELREEFFYRRWFLTERTAAFDAAALGLLLASRHRSPLPLLAALPYLRTLAKGSRRWGRRAPQVAATELAADAVGLVSLARASVSERSFLL